MKRIIASLMCLVLAAGLVPAPAFAQVDGPSELAALASGLSALANERAVTFGTSELADAVEEQLTARGVTCRRSGDLEITVDVSQVTELDLSNRYLSTVEGLEEFTRLTSLDISNNDIKDYAPLATLKDLVTLKANDNRVTSIDALCGLTNLEHLELATNDLVDEASTSANSITSKLSALTKLKHLDLSHDFIRYTNGLGNLVQLEYLDLYDNGVHDLAGLADPQGLAEGEPRLSTSLEHLDLGQNNEQTAAQIAGLENLKAFKNLTYLDFSENQTPSIVDYVGGLQNLEFLQLQNNGFTSAEKLAGLTKLKTLILAQNNITSITPLLGMKELVELNLKSSQFGGDWAATQHSLDDIFDDTTDSGLVWGKLQKIDLSRSWRSWGTSLKKLADLDWLDKKLQVNFEWRQVSDAATRYAGLPRYDEAGKTHYVTYEDFGARSDGKYDDYIAMVNAHDFANDWQAKHPDEVIEVRGTAGKEYHVFAYYESDWNQIMTNVDWNGATIVIHDEDIENKRARSNHLFVVRTLDGGVACDKRLGTPGKEQADVSGITVDTTYKAYGDKKLPEKLVNQFPEGYERYVVTFYNEDKMQHIRSGEVNKNNGEPQYDIVIARADGTLENDIQWDFDHLTRAIILPMPSKTGYIRNANIVSTGIRSKSQAPYYRSNGKYAYYERNLYAQYAANIEFSGITHRLGNPDNWKESWDEQSGSYFATISLNHASNITLRDSSFYGRKYTNTGRSTYDVCYGNGANIQFVNIKDSTGVDREHRWSVIGGHGGKDVLFEDCVTSSAGTHQTVYNMTIRNCDLGSIILCGQGLFLAENVTCHEQYFASLRNDYGTTWNGEVRILNCTHAYNAKNRPKLIDISFNKGADGQLPEYGYPLRFPKVLVDNLTVDYALNNRDRMYYCYENGPYYVVFNSETFDPVSQDGMPYVPTDYWPSNLTLNSVKFVNGEAQVARNSNPEVHLTASNKDHIGEGARNFLVSDVRVKAGGEDVTAKLFLGEQPSFSGLVTVSAGDAAGTADSFTLLKADGAGGYRTVKELSPADGAWQQVLAEPGDYEIRLSSTSDVHRWEGSRTLRFTVSGASRDVAFADVNLFNAVKAQLADKGIVFQSDDDARKLTLAEADLARVTELDLSTKLISGLGGLSAFTALERLDLSHNCVGDIDELAGLTALKHLDLYDNYVHDFSALSGHVQLAHLNLGENNEQAKGALAGLDAIKTLTGLTWFDFSQNYAPGITAQLGSLTGLEHLNLQQNDITDLAPLSSLSNLKTLVLSHNKVCGIHALLGLSNLEALDLNANQLYKTDQGAADTSGLAGIFTGEGAQRKLVWKNLKKLDIANNWDWNGLVGNPDTRLLLELDRAKSIELGYTLDRIYQYDKIFDPDTLVKYDGDVPYVTYDDFGARHDGEYDDFNAMRVAHDFANKHGCEVRATPGTTYHIFRPYDLTYYSVYTDVDWQGAEFVIHDEGIDGLGARYVPLFCLRPTSGATTETAAFQDIKTIADSLTVNGALGKGTTSVEGLSAELDEAINALGGDYDRFYIEAFNDKKKQYRRFGINANNGFDQRDGFIVDKYGKLEAGQTVQWDFSDVTKFVVTPIPKKTAHIRNATFYSTKLDSKREAAYARPNNKPIYYLRNLQLRDCANVEMSNVKQFVGTWEKKGADDPGTFTKGDDNDMTGSNNGFIEVRECADVKLTDCAVWARRYGEGGRSTYGLSMTGSVNLTLTRFNCSNEWEQLLDIGGTRWGVMGTNYCKHVLFDHCTVNRIDAHEGFYDMTARDCKLGSWGFRLIGQGPLTIERCDVYANSFIMLRGDYGSTWDGDARIVDCTHHCIGEYMQGLLSVTPSYENDTDLHDFGYELHCPNLYVKNYTVDYSMFADGKDGYCIVPNHAYDKRNERMLASYWPDKVEIDGLHFVNYEDTLGYEPYFRLVASEEGTIAGKLGGYSFENVTFNGSNEHASVEDGRQIEVPEDGRHIYDDGQDGSSTFLTPSMDVSGVALDGREFAVEFSGIIPTLAFMDANWGGWTQIEAYYATQPDAQGTRLAYYSGDSISVNWEASVVKAAAEGKAIGPIAKLCVRTSGHGDASSGGTYLKRVAVIERVGGNAGGGDSEGKDDPGSRDDSGSKQEPGGQRGSEGEQPGQEPGSGQQPGKGEGDQPGDKQEPSGEQPGQGDGRQEQGSAEPGREPAEDPKQDDTPSPSQPEKPDSGKATSGGKRVVAMPVYHIVDRKKSIHAYAAGAKAFPLLRQARWSYSGIAFYAPKSGTKVYELEKKKTGVRYYTTSAKKFRTLARSGWRSVGVAFHGLKSGGVPVYLMKKKTGGSYQLVKGKAAMKKQKKKGWTSKGVLVRGLR